MKKVMLVSLMITIYWNVHAKSFGVVGEVFPIAEKSFLVLIEKRLRTLTASGELEALNQKWINTVINHTNRPTPLDLERTKKTSKRYYTPEITLIQDITDHNGNIVYPKGTYVNALEQMPTYKPCWLFFNADEEAQLNWASRQINHCSNPKLILTGGAINTTEKKLNSVIYFDQEGKITTKLHIAHVPAKVTRHQNHLVIQEQAIKDNGDVF
ncbi:TPA: type-F conjugative transfer system protein TraW [Legionella pneumophila]|uniref:type-F conjugative transfer system protein TraW n=1 Tax=Legionella pneumophila TaxID=446 RepID=UPI000493F985|nr:type-F conjugative transfer system protein TraW [Legionella pneumophila]HAT2150933.1 type-F conjugative transfer system protein TraW [Legionella pneumophila]